MSSSSAGAPAGLISNIERCGSVLSVLGCVFIISTFLTNKDIRKKEINRLVFLATFGNLLTNVATLMSQDFTSDPESAGCQFQAVLIQAFMPADVLWMFAMSLNVYLTFYRNFDAARLRRMEYVYLACCYGIPFVIALPYAFISSPTRGKIYGDATLWCWVSPRWDILRIATFYGPIWVIILIAFGIYIRAGTQIYKKDRQLRDISLKSHNDPEPAAQPSLRDPFTSSKTTEVSVTTEVVGRDAINLGPLGGPSASIRRESESSAAPRPGAYSVTISSDRRPSDRQSFGDVDLPIQGNTASLPPQTANGTGVNIRRRAAYEANSALYAYTKTAILLFIAMLITWLPSSANRLWSVVHKESTSTPLEIMSALVLPLQGLWNAIIYGYTSRRILMAMINGRSNADSGSVFTTKASGRRRGTGSKVQELVGVRPFQTTGISGRNGSRLPGEKPYEYESESMTELAGSRPSSNDQSSLNKDPSRESDYPMRRL